jgi:hypothetical protein
MAFTRLPALYRLMENSEPLCGNVFILFFYFIFVSWKNPYRRKKASYGPFQFRKSPYGPAVWVFIVSRYMLGGLLPSHPVAGWCYEL